MIRSARQAPRLFYEAEALVSDRSTFYDRLNALGLSWDELTRPLHFAFCQDNGRPTDPTIYLKAFLVGALEGIEEDVELAARLSDSISIRMFLYGTLSESPPDHSSLGRVRRSISERCDLDLVLGKVVEVAKTRGLVGGHAVAVDTTLVPSRARRLFAEVPGADAAPEQIPDQMCEMSSPNRPAKPKQKMVSSSYDRQALPASKPGYKPRPSYKLSVSADYKNRVVLAVDAHLSSVSEGQAARSSIRDLAQSQGAPLGVVVADAGMDESAFHDCVELFGGTSVTGLKKGRAQAFGFGKARFLYDAKRNVYICPTGKVLNDTSDPNALRHDYSLPIAECRECPLKIACHGNRKGPKVIERNHDELARDRMLAVRKDPSNRKLLAYRKAVIEPIFADFKECGGLSKIWSKGLGCARVKAKFAGIAWNLKVLLNQRASAIKANRTKPRNPLVGYLAASQNTWIASLGRIGRLFLARNRPAF